MMNKLIFPGVILILLFSRIFCTSRRKNASQEARNEGPTLSSLASRIQAVLFLDGTRVKIS